MRHIVYVAIGLMLASCSHAGGGSASVEGSSRADAAVADSCLSVPVAPASVTDPEGRLAYALSHFWDRMDWRDTVLLADDAYMEQSMANFLGLMGRTDSLTASGAVNRMLASSASVPGGMERIVEIAGRYLYDPNSPMYMPECWAVVLDQLMLDSNGSGMTPEMIEHQHAEVMKNRVGQEAADFAFVTREGERMTLKGALKGTPQTVLLFYDPDCEVCAAVESRMASSERLNAMIDAGELRIVAVDPFDADRDKWRAHAASLPQGWTVGYSPGGRVDDGEIYVIHATPSAYVIDSAGRILAKDLTDPSAL